MAPEQIAGDRAAIGPRSDVFALGATLYSLLTGRPPFQAASVIETLDLVRTREPAPLRTLVPGLPRDLETIALTCLRKDPRRRYASAGALADDLQRWLDGFPIRARPVSKLEHASRWCRRRPAFASLLAVLAVTVASSLVGLLTLWRHSETERARAENALAGAIESDKVTSGVVRDLVGLLATTVDTPQMLASERFEKSSHAVAISRQNCVSIKGSPHPTSSRSANLNVNWRRISGVVVTSLNHARCSWTAWTYWKGEDMAHTTRLSTRRMHGADSNSGWSPANRSDWMRRWSVSSALRRYWKAWSTTRDIWR